MKSSNSMPLRKASFMLLLPFCVHAAISPRSQGCDRTGDSTPGSSGSGDKVCFSQSSPPQTELPIISESGWPTLTPSARWQLSRPARHASFNDLQRLTDRDAEQLARVPGGVSIGLQGDLSERAAAHFGRHRGYLSIGGLTRVSDSAAEALGQHHGPLVLLALSRVSNEALRGLACCQGELTIGLESLAPEQARILGRHRHGLCLPHVSSIDEETAEILGGYPGPLEIALTEASAGIARHLAKRSGPLAIGGTLRLNAEVAKELARYKGDLVISQNYNGPAEEVLAALSQHRGELAIVLEQPLTLGIARALRDHLGPLHVNVPPPFTSDVVAMLARNGHSSRLDLTGHLDLSANDLKALSHYQGGELRLRLGGDLDEGSCLALARYPGRLIIEDTPSNRTRASAKAVAALAAHRGRLSIPSTLIRDDTIDSLVAHNGGLHISMTNTDHDKLSIETVRKLAAVDGWLRIDGNLSTECLQALSAHSGDLALGELPQDKGAVEALLNRGGGRLHLPYRSQVKSIAAATLVASDVVISDINHSSFILGRDAVEIAAELAKRKGPFSMPYLSYVTKDALRALVRKDDIELKPLDDLYVFDEDGCIVSAQDVVPASFREFNRTHQPARSLEWHAQFYEQ